jgi:nucleosome binding factor SPN SPT16 subunit
MTMLLTPEKIYFATSQAKAKHLETLATKDGVPIEILKRTKDEEQNKKTFRDIIAAIKSAGVPPPPTRVV